MEECGLWMCNSVGDGGETATCHSMKRITRGRIHRVGPNDDSVLELNGLRRLVEFHHFDDVVGSAEETKIRITC